MSIFGDLIYQSREATQIVDISVNDFGHLALVAGTKLFGIDPFSGVRRNLNITVPNQASNVAFVGTDPMDVVVGSNNVNTPYKANLTTGTITTLGAGNFSALSGKYQMSAGNYTTGDYIGGSFTAGQVIKVNSAGTVSLLSPPGVAASGTVITVIRKPGTNNWVLGTTLGKIAYIDSTGADLGNFQIPASPVSGGGDLPYITSLAYHDASLLVGTRAGAIYHTDTATVTTQAIYPFGRPMGTPLGVIMSNVVNGLVAVCMPEAITQLISIWDLGTTPIAEVGQLLWPSGLGQPVGLQLSVFGHLWIASTNDIRAVEVKGLTTSTVTTRAQDPVGSDVAHRLLRIQANGRRYRMESDTSQSSGEQSVTARLSDTDYMDVSLIGTQFSSEKIDVRRFHS